MDEPTLMMTAVPPPTKPNTTAPARDMSGVAWTGGSLVGSLNPINHGFRTSDGKGGYLVTNTHKRYKRARRDADGNIIQEGDEDVDESIPGNVVVQFRDGDGAEVGGAMDVPTDAGCDELGALERDDARGEAVVVAALRSSGREKLRGVIVSGVIVGSHLACVWWVGLGARGGGREVGGGG